jgi:flagellar basal-body rod modification protein FlgD
MTDYNAVNVANGAAAATTDTTSKATKSLKGLADNYETFLKLLTTQLKNQDPMNPMESDKFTAQLAQFTGVEQQIATNKNMEKLLSMLSTNSLSDAVSYIDKVITASVDTNNLSNGECKFTYQLPSTASSVTVTIKDANGLTVYQGPGATDMGLNQFTWDGKNAYGQSVSDGAYTIVVAAKDGAGKDMSNVTTGIIGTVSGVEQTSDGSSVVIGSVTVPISKVTSVNKPTT